jgi:Tol biopolymer transport system component
MLAGLLLAASSAAAAPAPPTVVIDSPAQTSPPAIYAPGTTVPIECGATSAGSASPLVRFRVTVEALPPLAPALFTLYHIELRRSPVREHARRGLGAVLWDTTGLPEGPYRIVCEAENAAKATASVTVDVQVLRPPANLTLPVVTGEAMEEEILSTSTGTWAGTLPIAYAYQWVRCDDAGLNCIDIAGATTPDHVLTANDVGARVRVRVTATNVVGSAVAESEPTAVVEAARGPGGIAYLSREPGLFAFGNPVDEVFVVQIDGSLKKQLTFNSKDRFNAAPRWSPNYRKIAYKDGFSNKVIVIDADGSNPVTTISNARPAVSWAPDSKSFLVASNLTGGPVHIYQVSPTNAFAPRNLSGGTPGNGQEFWPCWSADGARIYYSNGQDIFRMNADGSGKTQITTGRKGASYPLVTPDEKHLFFNDHPNPNANVFDRLYRVDLTGGVFPVTQVTQVTTGRTSNNFSITPDGTKLLFSDIRPGGTNEFDRYTFMSDIDGSGRQVVVTHHVWPTFTPDGKLAIYDRFVNGGLRLFKLDLTAPPFTPVELPRPAGATWWEFSPDWAGYRPNF